MLGLQFANLINKQIDIAANQCSNTELLKYFPEITDTMQSDIFINFEKLIAKEENKMEYFHDSLINFEDLMQFNECKMKPKVSEVFTIDLGGSSLKITTVKKISL